MATSNNIRVRFAPSPTGHLHIGGIRSAIFNWLFARHHGGTYLLRVEDTDVARSTKEFLASQIRSLEWLGLMPDEPLVYQMSRLDEHHKAAQLLMQQGLAYPCFCPPRAADDVVSDLEQGHGSKYTGACRDKIYTPEDLQKPHAIRFKILKDITEVAFNDLILGSIRFDVDQLDDYIIIRRDGTPTYNFCVVVDDIFMKITHVIRGQDHVSNTPKQLLLYQAMGVKAPYFAHIPLLLGSNGEKLSKRDASVSVEEYRLEGYLPDALFNYLVRLGWSHGDQEIFTKEELIAYFTLDHVGKKGSIFDSKKLQWLNGVYLRKSLVPDILKYLQQINPAYTKELNELWKPIQLENLITQYKERAITLIDIYRDIKALASDPVSFDISLMAKWYTDKTAPMLRAFAEQLETIGEFHHDQLLALANAVCLQHECKLVGLAQPLRLALTGSMVSPGVFELITILGKERTKKRIEMLLKTLEKK